MQGVCIANIQQLKNFTTKRTGWERTIATLILETQESGFDTDTPFRRRV
jgi:hypothetical protein